MELQLTRIWKLLKLLVVSRAVSAGNRQVRAAWKFIIVRAVYGIKNLRGKKTKT
jgi:hypothetical protein